MTKISITYFLIDPWEGFKLPMPYTLDTHLYNALSITSLLVHDVFVTPRLKLKSPITSI